MRKSQKNMNVYHVNACEFISLENTYGYHFNADHHKLLGERIAEVIVPKSVE